jgi:hypothetical protein
MSGRQNGWVRDGKVDSHNVGSERVVFVRARNAPKSNTAVFGGWRHPPYTPDALFLLLQAHFATADEPRGFGQRRPVTLHFAKSSNESGRRRSLRTTPTAVLRIILSTKFDELAVLFETEPVRNMVAKIRLVPDNRAISLQGGIHALSPLRRQQPLRKPLLLVLRDRAETGRSPRHRPCPAFIHTSSAPLP